MNRDLKPFFSLIQKVNDCVPNVFHFIRDITWNSFIKTCTIHLHDKLLISLARFDWLLCDYNVVIPFYIIYLRNIEND